MDPKRLKKILDAHKLWLETNGQNGEMADLSGADLSGADLSGANLRRAILRGADLDFSCFPLWCGGLSVHIEDRQAIQLLYHLLYNVRFSKNTSAALKEVLLTKDMIEKANKFHRTECTRIELPAEEEDINYGKEG